MFGQDAELSGDDYGIEGDDFSIEGSYEIGAEDLAAYASGYSIGDDRTDRISRLLEAAAQGDDEAAAIMGWDMSGWDVGAVRRPRTVSASASIPAMRNASAAQVAQLQARIRNLTSQLAAARRHSPIPYPKLAGAYPTVGPGGQLSYPPAMQGAAASPVRGGFGALGPVSPARVTEPREVLGTPLGFDSTSTVAAGASTTVTSQPQQVYRCERLFVPDSLAPFFIITDIKVGNRSQLSNQTALPAQAFSQNSVGAALRFETAQVSQQVSITVTNIDSSAHRFLAAMFGTSLQ